MTLLNADIDHTLGLLLLRESHRLCVYATDFVRGALLEGNSYFAMLKQFEGQCAWRPLTEGAGFELRGQGNVASGIFCAGFELGGAPPFWAKERFTSGVGAVSGMTFESAGRRVGYFPSVPEFDGKLRDTLASCEVIFVDGTFWTDTELPELRGAGRTARQMGHVPMSETLKTLSALPLAVKKYFIHINNTNPALNEKGAQYASLRTAGWELAYDGLELNL